MHFGKLVDESQVAAEELLGNQVPETISLAKHARALGAYAASAFGAGFGGSVWALVSRSEAEQFAGDGAKPMQQVRTLCSVKRVLRHRCGTVL